MVYKKIRETLPYKSTRVNAAMKSYQSFILMGSLFFLCLAYNVSPGKAQPIRVGVFGGMDISSHIHDFRFSNQDIDLNFNPKVAVGYQGGLILRKDISSTLRFQAEPSIILLGARYNDTFLLRGFEFQTKSRTELRYIQLPLLLQLSTQPRSKTVFGQPFAVTTYHVTGGVFGGYLMDAQFSGTNTGAPIGIAFDGKFSNDISSQYSDYDGGVILGIGLEHGQQHKLGFETRAQFSVVNSGDDPALNFSTQNIAVTFAVYFVL